MLGYFCSERDGVLAVVPTILPLLLPWTQAPAGGPLV